MAACFPQGKQPIALSTRKVSNLILSDGWEIIQDQTVVDSVFKVTYILLSLCLFFITPAVQYHTVDA